MLEKVNRSMTTRGIVKSGVETLRRFRWAGSVSPWYLIALMLGTICLGATPAHAVDADNYVNFGDLPGEKEPPASEFTIAFIFAPSTGIVLPGSMSIAESPNFGDFGFDTVLENAAGQYIFEWTDAGGDILTITTNPGFGNPGSSIVLANLNCITTPCLDLSGVTNFSMEADVVATPEPRTANLSALGILAFGLIRVRSASR
ncbi:MAG: hypothetical protein WBP79_08725 [Candidatus Acidiferrales bacterium]